MGVPTFDVTFTERVKNDANENPPFNDLNILSNASFLYTVNRISFFTYRRFLTVMFTH